MRSIAVLGVSLLLIACPRPLPPAPPPVADPTCETACSNLARLKCESAKATAEGASCTEICTNVQTSGVVHWNLSCLSDARDCKVAADCN